MHFILVWGKGKGGYKPMAGGFGLKLYFLIFCFSLSCLASLESIKKVSALNSVEPYVPQVFHNGQLWLGRGDHSNHPSRYSIEVWADDGGKLLSSKPVPHSVQYLFPFDKEHILLTGKLFTRSGWRTYYSLTSFKNGRLKLTTHQLPSRFQVEEFTGGPKKLFFNMVSDQTLVEVKSFTHRQLPLKISGPGVMFEIEDSIFVLERNSRFLGDENVVKVDLKTLKTERVFPKLRNGILSILPLNGGTLLAASEALAHQVLLIDTQTHTLKWTVPTPGTHPYSMAQLGHCLAVGSFDPAKLTLIDLNNPVPSVVAEVDLNPYLYELPNLAKLSINPETGMFFMRSIGINSDVEGMTNSVFSFFSPDWISRCRNF